MNMNKLADGMNLTVELDGLSGAGTRGAARGGTETNREGAEVVLRDEERQRCEVWTRVMGYHRPVASFNVGKQGEHAERRFFRAEA